MKTEADTQSYSVTGKRPRRRTFSGEVEIAAKDGVIAYKITEHAADLAKSYFIDISFTK